jgi:hypothetical protein
MLDELLAVRQAGRRVDGVPALAAVEAAAAALDREAKPAPARRTSELDAADHVVGAVVQPSGRVRGIGIGKNDDERDAVGHRRDLGRRRRHSVAVDENEIEAIAVCQSLGGVGPAGARFDGEPGRSKRGGSDGEDAKRRAVHRSVRSSIDNIRRF